MGGALLLAAMVWLRTANYLLFHGLGEMISLLMAAGVFTVAWNSRSLWRNGYLLTLGLAMLCASGLHLVHTLTRASMGIAGPFDPNQPAQLRIAASYMQSVPLLIAPFLIRRPRNPYLILAAYVAVFTLVLLSVFQWGNFPACIGPTGRETVFMTASEWLACACLAGAAVLLHRRRAAFEPRTFGLLLAALSAAWLGQFNLALTQDPTGLANLLGHYFRIVANALVYYAFVEQGILLPYRIIRRRTEELNATVARLQRESLARRRLEGEVLSTSDREQRRIGHDLHDSVGQNLSAIAYLAGDLRQALADRGIPEAQDVERIEKLASETVELTHGIVHSLSPLGDQSERLLPSLEEMAARVSITHGVTCVVRHHRPVVLDNDLPAIHLYRIAQEAITNAIRHGRADRITVRLETGARGLCLSVRDNGLGIAHLDRQSTGMGLRIMRYRAASLGAKLSIGRGRRGGTLIRCRLPRQDRLSSHCAT